jgi:anti-sigma factor RsiW
MTHGEFQDRLDAFVDGELDPVARDAMQEHAGTCASCAAALAATRALVENARRLPGAIEPEHDLWARVESTLKVRTPRRRGWNTVAWLAAASVTLGVATLWSRARDPINAHVAAAAVESDAAFNGLVSGLELECLGAGASLQASLRLPGAVRSGTALAAWTPVLSDAVAILDRSIAETRSAIALAPEDTVLQALLAARYRQKLEILGAALASVEKT